MKVQFADLASADLVPIHAYVARDKLGAAARVAVRIKETALQLSRFPLIGRQGLRPGTRELGVRGLPYILVD